MFKLVFDRWTWISKSALISSSRRISLMASSSLKKYWNHLSRTICDKITFCGLAVVLLVNLEVFEDWQEHLLEHDQSRHDDSLPWSPNVPKHSRYFYSPTRLKIYLCFCQIYSKFSNFRSLIFNKSILLLQFSYFCHNLFFCVFCSTLWFMKSLNLIFGLINISSRAFFPSF